MIYLTLTCTSKCSVIVIDWYFKMNLVEATPIVIPSHFIRLINRILIIILFILASIYDNHNIFHLYVPTVRLLYFFVVGRRCRSLVAF